MSLRRIIIVPHMHWDREWYEPEAVFRLGLVAAVDCALDMLEEGELPVFLLDGQLAIVEDYLGVRPEQIERVRRLAMDRKLLMGPWYVLADELLTGDEALVRNLLIGREIADRVGRWLPVGYSPDAFGHPAALPSILRGFGIETAIVWRGYGGEKGQGGDLFAWHAPDGAQVLTHHLPPDGYEVGAELPLATDELASRWADLRAAMEERAGTGIVLLLNGADHHSPQTGLNEVARRLATVAGTDVSVASPETYFAAVADARVPTVRGELRFSYRYTWTLQGVHATRSRLKRRIAEGEHLLTRWVEPQVALSGGADSGVLAQLWREHLQSCAHDSIGGCCSDEVAADVGRRAAGVARAARRAWVDAALRRIGYDPVEARRRPRDWQPSLIVVNATPRSRGGVVEATLTFKVADVVVGRPREPRRIPLVPPVDHTPTPSVVSLDGETLPIQVLSSSVGYERIESPRHYPDQDVVHRIRVAVWVPPVPPLGLRGFAMHDSVGAPPCGVGAEAVRSIRDGIRSLQWDVCGVGRGFRVEARGDARTWLDCADIESDADEGDTYTFQPNGSPVRAEWAPPEVVYDGPLVAVVARRFDVPGRARGTVFMRLAANSDPIWVTVQGENLAVGHRLRVRFPAARSDTGSHALPSVADMHYGCVARYRTEYAPEAYPSEWPVATAPMHRFVSVGGTRGITVFARGAFEYEHDAKGGVRMTILRSVDQLSRSDLAARPGHAGWPVPTPDAAELGPFRLEMGWWGGGVSPNSRGEEWDTLTRVSEAFHAPLAGLSLRSTLAVPPPLEGPQLIGSGVAMRAVKPGRKPGTVVLRCVNLTARPVKGAWMWPGSIQRAVRARLDETPVGKQAIRVAKHRIPFTAKPHEIVTIVVTVSRDRES